LHSTSLFFFLHSLSFFLHSWSLCLHSTSLPQNSTSLLDEFFSTFDESLSPLYETLSSPNVPISALFEAYTVSFSLHFIILLLHSTSLLLHSTSPSLRCTRLSPSSPGLFLRVPSPSLPSTSSTLGLAMSAFANLYFHTANAANAANASLRTTSSFQQPRKLLLRALRRLLDFTSTALQSTSFCLHPIHLSSTLPVFL